MASEGSTYSATGIFYIIPFSDVQVVNDDGETVTESLPDWSAPVQAKFLILPGVVDAYPAGSQENTLYEISTYNAENLSSDATENCSPTILGSTSGGPSPLDNPGNLFIVPADFELSSFVTLAQSYAQQMAQIDGLVTNGLSGDGSGEAAEVDAAWAALLLRIRNDFKTGGQYDIQRSDLPGVGDVPAGADGTAFQDAASWVYAFTLGVAGLPESIAIAGAAGSNLAGRCKTLAFTVID